MLIYLFLCEYEFMFAYYKIRLKHIYVHSSIYTNILTTKILNEFNNDLKLQCRKTLQVNRKLIKIKCNDGTLHYKTNYYFSIYNQYRTISKYTNDILFFVAVIIEGLESNNVLSLLHIQTPLTVIQLGLFLKFA